MGVYNRLPLVLARTLFRRCGGSGRTLSSGQGKALEDFTQLPETY
jgi:hypothetical protein